VEAATAGVVGVPVWRAASIPRRAGRPRFRIMEVVSLGASLIYRRWGSATTVGGLHRRKGQRWSEDCGQRREDCVAARRLLCDDMGRHRERWGIFWWTVSFGIAGISRGKVISEVSASRQTRDRFEALDISVLRSGFVGWDALSLFILV
jgi:hypothetical protein